MKKLVVVTNVLAHYQIDFFNKVVEIDKDIDLTVFADIYSESALNNFDEHKCNFNVENSTLKRIGGFIFRKSIKKRIDSIDPDFLIFYANPRELYLSFLMFFYWILGRKFFVHGMFHRIGGQTIFSKLYYLFVGCIANKCFTYSRKGAEILMGLGVKYNKIKIIGTAIDEKKSLYYRNKINEVKLENFKRENGILNKKVVLQVVRLSKIKKPDMILSVARRLISYRTDIVFILIGGGEMYDEMSLRIKALGLESIVFLLGPIYDEDILSYWFSAAKLFVMPTCIGLSAHHAFSYSLPIVTDDNLLEQASEFDILSNGLNSILYESGNIDSFEESILNVIDNKALQSVLSDNALHTVKFVNSLESKCKRYLDNL